MRNSPFTYTVDDDAGRGRGGWLQQSWAAPPDLPDEAAGAAGWTTTPTSWPLVGRLLGSLGVPASASPPPPPAPLLEALQQLAAAALAAATSSCCWWAVAAAAASLSVAGTVYLLKQESSGDVSGGGDLDVRQLLHLWLCLTASSERLQQQLSAGAGEPQPRPPTSSTPLQDAAVEGAAELLASPAAPPRPLTRVLSEHWG
ncbi:Otoferlin [Frankliniella fusca]|uniref:Otoferlin n=1 Tax=Frankliniella fusca TaxID=407009 RepID=A0AAE1LR84_9NEOP|nr:Otoferlin [Frankliniella fusca]